MAVTAEKVELPVRKTRADSGFLGWLSTVDHKRIGILYFVTGILFLVVGGIEALLIRLQLMKPLNTVLTGRVYNEVLTQHGTVMLFFAATPIIWGIFNYVLPIAIGARDVAFPRLNMMSWWCALWGGIIVNAAWFLGGAADAGWFIYAPLSTKFSPGVGMDAYLVGVLLGQISTLLTGLNFVVTILRLRAPGMGLMQMPPMAWYLLVASVLGITAGVPFNVAMVLMMLDRWFGTSFFEPSTGGDAMLWQHLFWLFGHPEVYILVLPAFACVSEVLPTFARKPYFGYRSMVAAISSIGIVSWVVWGHHVYQTGMGASANTYFVISTKAVSVPTAMVLFNWLATLWGGKIRFALPMYWAAAFLFVFTVGGLTGLVNASSSVDRHMQNNMWVVGHFHYVAIGGIVFALLAGITYWWPKATGRMLNEGLGKLSFWVTFAGFNLTFFPMLLEGLIGMPRRVYTYLPEQGWAPYNAVATIGALVQALGIVLLVVCWLESLIRGPKAKGDAWGEGRNLEWSVPSPAPAYNFARLPLVRSREPFWEEKVNGNGRMQPAPDELDRARHGNAVHMPSPSFMPALVGLGLGVTGFGLVLHATTLTLLGLVIGVLAVIGWALEDARGYYLVTEEGEA